jgi:putative YphP/YqiW family bacilliredoxin
MYDERLIQPMRDDLVKIGFEEMRTAEQVDEVIPNRKGTNLVVVNSVCGCAAGMARPGVALALTHSVKPDHLTTVFAGQDREATTRAREYIIGQMPSSPSMALFKDGELVWFLPRYQIEGQTAEQVAAALITAFDQFCAKVAVSDN